MIWTVCWLKNEILRENENEDVNFKGIDSNTKEGKKNVIYDSASKIITVIVTLDDLSKTQRIVWYIKKELIKFTRNVANANFVNIKCSLEFHCSLETTEIDTEVLNSE